MRPYFSSPSLSLSFLSFEDTKSSKDNHREHVCHRLLLIESLLKQRKEREIGLFVGQSFILVGENRAL